MLPQCTGIRFEYDTATWCPIDFDKPPACITRTKAVFDKNAAISANLCKRNEPVNYSSTVNRPTNKTLF